MVETEQELISAKRSLQELSKDVNDKSETQARVIKGCK
jgi:hypothetical protein